MGYKHALENHRFWLKSTFVKSDSERFQDEKRFLGFVRLVAPVKIFEALRDDHETQRTLARLLIKTHGDTEGRRGLLDR